MRVTIDLMKKSTQIIDLSDVINPRVGDDDLLLPLHICYGDNLYDMRENDVEFLTQDTNKNNIYIAGTCNTNTPGDNLYTGDLTFRFPAGTFKVDGTYDPDQTMFRIVDKATQKVISSVNVKITVMKNAIEFNFDPNQSSYDSRAETMLQDFHDKGQAMLDEITSLNNQAKSNVSEDTAATANAAKQQADANAGDISDLKGEIAGARGRFADLPGREDAQDTAINQKEGIVNANANYAALQQKDAQQDAILTNKADKFELENKLAQMNLQPEMYADLDAVKAAYPNGATKLIATDDGYLALYQNGQWVKGPVFQAVGLTDDQNNRIMGIYQDTINITTQTVAGTEIKPAYGIDLGRHWLFIQGSDENVRKRAGELDYPQPLTDEQGVFTYNRSVDSKQFSQTWITANHIYIRQLHDQVWSDWQVYQPYQVDADSNLLNGKVDATTNDSVVTKVEFMGHDWYQLTATGTSGSRGIEWHLSGDAELSQFFNKSTLFTTDIYPMFSQTLTLTLNFYDASGNNLNKSIDVDKINLVANQPLHYENIIIVDPSLATNVANVGISIQTKSTADIGKTLFGTTELTSNFDSYKNDSGLLTTPAILQSGDQNTVLSKEVFVGEIWHKLALTNNAGANQGIIWKVMDPNSIYMLFHNRGRFSFDIFPYVTLAATVNVHLYDYFGKDLNKTITIDTVQLQTGQMKHYDYTFTLDEALADGVVQVGISIEAVNKADNASFLVHGEKLSVEYLSEDDARNDPVSDLPAVYLSGDTSSMTKDNKVTMNFVFKDRTRTITGYAATKWQGDSSINYSKKAYRIQTFSDSALKNNLEFKPKSDWSAGNKWNLKAYFTDALLCRDVVNANLGADVWANADNVPNTLIKGDNFGFIDGFPVKLYLNGSFSGIYSFNLAKGDYGNDPKAIIGSVQAGAAQFGSLPDGGVKLDGQTDFEMISPDAPTDEIKTSLNNLIKFVATSTDADFKAQFDQYLDKTSVIDYLIFCNVIEDTDAWIKNQTLFTIDGNKWYYHPYDLDMSLGSSSDGTVFDITNGVIGIDTNTLFKRVNQLFSDDVKVRYKDLRNWLTPAYILNRYRQHMDRIGVANYQAEDDIWHDSAVAFGNYTVLKSHVYHRFSKLDKAWLN